VQARGVRAFRGMLHLMQLRPFSAWLCSTARHRAGRGFRCRKCGGQESVLGRLEFGGEDPDGWVASARVGDLDGVDAGQVAGLQWSCPGQSAVPQRRAGVGEDGPQPERLLSHGEATVARRCGHGSHDPG
jgi:hypothetical protein